MSKYEGAGVVHQESTLDHVVLDKEPQGQVQEVHAASVALAAAMAARPPQLLSKSMIKYV